MSIINIAENLWVAEGKMTLKKGFLPIAVPSTLGQCSVRMTIFKLRDGGLFLHSPIPYSDDLSQELIKLGNPKFIIGPSVMHNSNLLKWQSKFPEASVVVAPKTEKRDPRLTGYPTLDDSHPVTAELGQILIRGHRNYETFFLHSGSRTLIVTDLAYSLHPKADLLEKIFLIVAGVRNPLGLTFYQKNSVSNPKEFRVSLEKVLEWDFDRMIMSHGKILESNGKKEFRRIWSEALK